MSIILFVIFFNICVQNIVNRHNIRYLKYLLNVHNNKRRKQTVNFFYQLDKKKIYIYIFRLMDISIYNVGSLFVHETNTLKRQKEKKYDIHTKKEKERKRGVKRSQGSRKGLTRGAIEEKRGKEKEGKGSSTI